MKPAPFEYHAPESLPEAVALLGRFGDDGKVLAGGQSLIPILSLRLSRLDHLVDLRKIGELQSIERQGDEVVVGAMVSQVRVERSPEVEAVVPLVAAATHLIGHRQIRSRGTIGGSLAHADPAAEYPTVACVLDAEFDVVGPDGSRRVPASEFFQGTWTTALAPEEILAAVRFSGWGGRSGFAIREFARRHGDFALAGAACGVTVADGRITRSALGLLGMGSTPLRAAVAERALTGLAVDSVPVEEIARLAVDDLDPPADIHASSAHRRRIAASVAGQAITAAIKEASDG